MASGGRYDDPDEYYAKLKKLTFKGSFVGTHPILKKTWYKIKVKTTTGKLNQYLAEIEKNFGEKIWKGYHNGCFYINSSEFKDDEEDTTYKIIDYDYFSFPPDQWREKKKYEKETGYHVVLERVKDD